MAESTHSIGAKRFERACPECGAGFSTNITIKTFCSLRCSQVGARERATLNRAERMCEGCQKAFRPKGVDRARFCSRECAFDAIRKEAEARRPVRLCIKCDDPLIEARRRVCAACRGKPQYVPIPKVIAACVDCGLPTSVGSAGKRFCDECQRKKARAQRRKIKRKHKHRGRARQFGVQYEPIDPIKVFDRDGWRCQVCGVKTPKRLRGTFKDAAPELDHRVAMASGGDHLWSNVQCCCRSCNLKKGASHAVGQMNLFPHPVA